MEDSARVNSNDMDNKREILNKLSKNIDSFNENDKNLLQQISEEMDKLILEYIEKQDY